MKKFINAAGDVVEEMLQGLAVLQPGSARLAGHKVLVRADYEEMRDRQVAILSGGGSGHEPAHAGYIGAGMLSAAVAGEVFTSPSSDSVLAATLAVAGKPGALLVVKNYTGDRLNFGVAAEMARAQGIAVEMVVVDDDVALRGGDQKAGARGLAGTVLIHKLVGAAAAEGKSLAEVAEVGRAAVKALGTMGISFSAGTSPAVGKPSFELGPSEMEIGLGIHGEPGVRRAELRAADEMIDSLLDEIVRHRSAGRVAVMINNLGATTPMELAIVARRVVPGLQSRGYVVERVYAGTFLSSLDMAGISLSVIGVDDRRLRYLDADTDAPAWPRVPRERPRTAEARAPELSSIRVAGGDLSETGLRVKRAVAAACEALIAAEGELTELDRITGDGDLGVNMARAARAVLSGLETYPLNDVGATLQALGDTLRRELGGSSGPLYGVLFMRCGAVLGSGGEWVPALEQGIGAITELGGAKAGDRTMLDALLPFVEALKSNEGLLNAVAAAERGADATAQMRPKAGRSSYLGERVIGYPDPGAKAVSIWLKVAVGEL